MKRETKCVHSGNFIDPATKGINTPIYTSSVYENVVVEKPPKGGTTSGVSKISCDCPAIRDTYLTF